MPQRRSLAEYTACRLSLLESVVERGHALWKAAKEQSVNPFTARRWLAQHASGEASLADLRSGEATLAPTADVQTHYEISPLNPTEKLRRIIDRIRSGNGREPTREQLLMYTAPYVLHQDAPNDHLIAWIRFYVETWGHN